MKRFFSTTSTVGFFNRLNNALIKAAPRDHVVQELKKPVGLECSPDRSIPYTKGNSLKDMFKQDKTTQRAEELALEFSKSGMYDVYTFRKTNGKLFLSPPSYWRAEKSLYFPHLVGRTLANAEKTCLEDTLRGKLSIIKIATSVAGEKLVNSYFQNENIDYLANGHELLNDKQSTMSTAAAQIIDINFSENWVKSLIVNLSLRKLRNEIPERRHSQYFVCAREQLPFMIREKLLLNNPYTGYVYVVDPQLRIRWMACGAAQPKDFELLWKCVRGLQKELVNQ
ncbi:Atp10p Ecym_3266 [Eremothecium cymbalariae DBVPG|uniref:Mitochondrial ATPase complex subunit ATP10 n=1 Tax=Eremothecium cymbalariae (strain CBS 270.75 / DBVPG 7215 / KCTC 17166 / NRRL Y-17582) TaxID=931890 RepID=G8JRJ0_ERECY|nr:Hypothetical protein Ecym_3266 [Eremothecium cymbalariae DBVPG\